MIKYTQLKNKEGNTISIESDTANAIHSKLEGTIDTIIGNSILVDEGVLPTDTITLSSSTIQIYNNWLLYLQSLSISNVNKLKLAFDAAFAISKPILTISAVNKYNAGERLVVDVVNLGNSKTNFAGKKYLLKYK